MIVHPCQWEPERSAMSPPAELFPIKKRKAGAYSPCLSIYQGIAATPESSPFPVQPGTGLSPSTVNHSRAAWHGSGKSLPVPFGAATEDSRREECGPRSVESDPRYATDRSEFRSDIEECVRFSIASFSSSIPNGLSRQTSAPAFLRFCRAYRLPLIPMT